MIGCVDPEVSLAYEARFGWNPRSGFVIICGALFVAIGIFIPMSTALRVVDFAFFGGGAILMLGVVCSRQLALRVDAQGVTLGGMPPRHRSKTTFVPWADVEKVVLWEQTLPPYGQHMPWIGLVRRPGAPALAAARGQRFARGVTTALALPVSPETLSTSRGVNGWRLDKQRLAAAIHRFAPGVPLVDEWTRPRWRVRRLRGPQRLLRGHLDGRASLDVPIPR